MDPNREHKGEKIPARPRSGRPREEMPEAERPEAEGPAAEAGEVPGPETAEEPKRTVVMPGRNTKRKAFFENHTGPAASVLAAAVVLFAAGSIILNRCGAEKETQPEASAPPVMAVLPGAEYEPPEPAAEPEPEPHHQPEEEPLALTEAQVEELDGMLAAWAETETLVDVREKDEEGNLIGDEPKMEARGGQDVAVWFYDVESGAEYAYNTEHKFIYASLMKAPYATYLYQLADVGECDLEELFTIGPGHLEGYEENTGVIKEMTLPQQMSCEMLIGLMLEYSDTVALRALTQRYPVSGFKEWAGELGVENPDELSTILSGNISAGEMALLFRQVYEYTEHGPNGELLRSHMGNTNYTLITSQHPVVHKYGWDESAYHDSAIVYAPHPYLLLIMTDKWGGSGEERKMFGEIAARLEQMMDEVRMV